MDRFFVRVALALTLSLIVAVAGGCERLRAWKSAWHAGGAAKPMGALQVSVEPHEGISILLDGNHVAHASPWQGESLPTGPHVLEVRGMGHYSVTLPVVLSAEQPVHLPVRLRPRPALPFGPARAEAEGAGDAAHTGGNAPPATPVTTVAAPAPTPPAPARRPALPGNTRPLRLSIEPRPAAAITVDGVAADADDVRLLHGDGLLVVGDMSLRYRVRAGRGLELTVPHEPPPRAAWFVGASQVKANSQVRISASPLVLRRRQAGRQQQATLRRLD